MNFQYEPEKEYKRKNIPPGYFGKKSKRLWLAAVDATHLSFNIIIFDLGNSISKTCIPFRSFLRDNAENQKLGKFISGSLQLGWRWFTF